MADELAKVGAAPPPMAVTASGDATAIGAVYGDVRLEMGVQALELLQKLTGSTMPVSHAAEWALLNTERFHVFVLENEKYDCGAFSIGRRVALEKNTIDRYKDYYKPLTPSLIRELLDMPCIFAIRNQQFKKAPDYYPALLGKLTDIRCQGETIRFSFITCGRLKQQFINDNIRAFALRTSTVRNQLDEEHWSIREGNLLQIANDMGIVID